MNKLYLYQIDTVDAKPMHGHFAVNVNIKSRKDELDTDVLPVIYGLLLLNLLCV